MVQSPCAAPSQQWKADHASHWRKIAASPGAGADRLPGHDVGQRDDATWTVLADPETFYVEDYEGPLLPGELDRAREWGEELGRRLAGTAGSE